MKTTHHEGNLFRSKMFRRIFISYVVLIVAFIAGYCTWYLINTRQRVREDALRSARQTGAEFATEMDRTVLTAQSLCGAMNTSENFRAIYNAI